MTTQETMASTRGRVVRLADAPLMSAWEGGQLFRSTLNAETTGTKVVSGGWYRVAPGVTNHLDMHPDRDEFYFIHSGRATIVMDGETMVMTPGDTVFVPHGVEHYIINEGETPLELFFLFAPAEPPFPARVDDRYPVVEFAPA
jgi:mannose-6-phosphate isomerase-like protein (cupin superfamily)